MEIVVNVLRCWRCGYWWLSKKDDIRLCANPKCRSVYWDRPNKKDEQFRILQHRGHSATTKRIKSGALVNLRKANNVKCTDCSSIATIYHHEDYSKPLEVVPLCEPCNAAKGKTNINGEKIIKHKKGSIHYKRFTSVSDYREYRRQITNRNSIK